MNEQTTPIDQTLTSSIPPQMPPDSVADRIARDRTTASEQILSSAQTEFHGDELPAMEPDPAAMQARYELLQSFGRKRIGKRTEIKLLESIWHHLNVWDTESDPRDFNAAMSSVRILWVIRTLGGRRSPSITTNRSHTMAKKKAKKAAKKSAKKSKKY